MGGKQSRLSEEDFRFLQEETGMSKATLQVNNVKTEIHWECLDGRLNVNMTKTGVLPLLLIGVVCQLLKRLPKWRAFGEEVHPSVYSTGKNISWVHVINP